MTRGRITGYRYLGCCVDLPGRHIRNMLDSSREIRYRTFRRYVKDLDAWAIGMLYFKDPRQGLTLKNDWHVAYYSGRYGGDGSPGGGVKCYFLQHSAIEHIWVPTFERFYSTGERCYRFR